MALALALVACGAVAGPALAGGAKADAEESALQITRGEQETAGEFGHAGVLVTFTARAESATAVSTRVEVGAVLLEATLDREKQEAFWTGHGRALSTEQREALVAFSRELAKGLTARDPAALPAHEDLLRRVVALWAEAPAGHPLDGHTVIAPAPTRGTPRRNGPIFSEGAANTAPDAPQCQYPDNNGITYFSCSYHYDVVCHDATSHCWGCEVVPVGCGGNCLGECGPGCAGIDVVSWDCGDHDRCCQVHGGCFNPWDSSCGDEYGEASDDFLFGWPNCWFCGGI